MTGGWQWLGGDSTLAAGWHNVQATYDGSSVRTFIDGRQIYFARYPFGPLAADTTSPLYVGTRSPGVGRMKGSLDRVKILSYAVNPQDSLGPRTGLITKAELAADSIAGLAAYLDLRMNPLLDAKANLAGASFTGKVGFGTTTPTAPIDVDITGAAFNKDTTLARFTYRTTGGRSADFLIDYRGLSSGDGSLAFREDRAAKDFMVVNMLPTGSGPRVIFPTGRVGIGTNTPMGLLDVQGGSAATGAGAPIILNAQKGGASGAGGNIVINSGENGAGGAVGNILFSAGGVPGTGGTTTNEIMRITGSGEVGIGSNYAGVPLTVSRTGSVPAVVRIQGNSTQNAPLTALELRHVNTPVGGNVGQAVDVDFTVELASTGAQTVAAKIRAGKEEDFTVPANADSYLAFSTMKDGTASEKVRINSQGDLVAGPNILMNGTNANGMITSNRVSISAAGPQDFIRFLKNGVVYGTNAVVGYLYVYAKNLDDGANAESDIYIITTTGNGITDASAELVKSKVRGVSPVSAISLVNDGTGGGVKLVITKTTGTVALEVFSTFVGTVF